MFAKSLLGATVATGLLSFSMLGAAFAADTYKLDPEHTRVEFLYDHFGISEQTGRFEGLCCKLSRET